MSGRAGPKLLESFNTERQPVGVDVVTRANQGLRDHALWMETIGMMEPDVEKRKKILAEFDDPGQKGREKREAFINGIENTATEFHGLGIEMNQRYFSDAVYAADEGESDPLPEDKIRQHQITTYPGRRLPHAWLNTRSPKIPFSTIDLAGHGCFCLFTGPSGLAWKDAASKVSKSLGVQIRAYNIGWRGDYEDVYFDWSRRREVDEDGCVLVRPDRFVAWRSKGMIQDCGAKLEKVLKNILALESESVNKGSVNKGSVDGGSVNEGSINGGL